MPVSTARPIRQDLTGDPAVNAAAMRCGVCACGDSVGIDMVDRAGETICHGHFDIETAEAFLRLYADAIAEAKARTNPQ